MMYKPLSRLTRWPHSRVIGYVCAVIVIFGFGYMCGVISRMSSCDDCTARLNSQMNALRMYYSADTQLTDKTYLIVIIMSALHNSDRRDVIRQTWLRLAAQRNLRHYFIIGTLDVSDSELNALYNEQRLHNDLILFSHIKDTYSALTHKLLSSLKWFSNKIDFKYLLKLDDDSFAQIDVIFDELLETRNNEKLPLFWGYFDGRARVKRSGHWSESKWFLCDRYLPYALGGGYVLSKQLVNFVAKNTDILQLYNNEDVSLGVWLSPLNIKRVHDIRFDTEYQSRGCINTHLITHKQSSDSMRNMYNNLQSFGKLCKNEIEKQYSYNYNWNVLPSLCCQRNITIKSLK